MRISAAANVYSKKKIMQWVKNKQMAYIRNIIANQPILANATEMNVTKNDYLMFISFVVKLIELVSLIFITSYFFLIIWVLLCEGIEDFILEYENDEIPADAEEHFFPTYGLTNEHLSLVSLKIFYYAFTSLTTVGFGDFYPISTKE